MFIVKIRPLAHQFSGCLISDLSRNKTTTKSSLFGKIIEITEAKMHMAPADGALKTVDFEAARQEALTSFSKC